MPDGLIQLIYTSKAVRPLGQAELLALLERAQGFNAEHGITGVLLYAHARFIQVLEGTPSAVVSLFSRIEDDLRHDHVRVVMRRAIARRDFGDWQMAFRELDANTFAAYPHLSRFFEADFSDEHFLPWASPAGYLLRAFRETA